MLKADSYTAKGSKQKDKVSLPKDIEEVENAGLLAQAIHVYRDRSHTGTSRTKTRGEINLTTKKWYRQKGTGRARHGAQSAPIFVGGSKAHGPKGVKRELNLTKKLRRKALNIALTMKAKAGELVFVDGVKSWNKTKEAQQFIDKLAAERDLGNSTRFTFVLDEASNSAVRVIRNLSSVEYMYFKDLNAYSVYYGGVLIIDKEILNKKDEN